MRSDCFHGYPRWGCPICNRGANARLAQSPLLDQFNSRWTPEPFSGCHLWIGSSTYHGYGLLLGKRAHRISWELFRGPVPNGLLVCHECDTPICVNPEHLFLGTPGDNSRDKMRKGRWRKGDRPQGEACRSAKLKEGDALFILNSSESSRELAARFKVCTDTVSNIRGRRTWRYLGEPGGV